MPTEKEECKELERYECEPDYGHEHSDLEFPDMTKCTDGDWVKWNDIKQLITQIKEQPDAVALKLIKFFIDSDKNNIGFIKTYAKKFLEQPSLSANKQEIPEGHAMPYTCHECSQYKIPEEKICAIGAMCYGSEECKRYFNI